MRWELFIESSTERFQQTDINSLNREAVLNFFTFSLSSPSSIIYGFDQTFYVFRRKISSYQHHPIKIYQGSEYYLRNRIRRPVLVAVSGTSGRKGPLAKIKKSSPHFSCQRWDRFMASRANIKGSKGRRSKISIQESSPLTKNLPELTLPSSMKKGSSSSSTKSQQSDNHSSSKKNKA